MQSTLQRHLPLLALILAMILWASSFIALKIALQNYDPMIVIFGRLFIASLCFLLIGRRLYMTLDYRRGDFKAILFMAFCEPCLYFLFEGNAVVFTTASQAGIITAILPILVMVAASLFLKEKIKRKSWAGAAAALLGVCWLTLQSSPVDNAPNPMLGNFFEVMAMVCATGYIITLKSLTSRYSPFFLTAVQAFFGTLFYFPLLFLPTTAYPVHYTLGPSLAIVYLGGGITLGAYGLYNYSVKHFPASRTAAFINLIPIFSVLLGWLVLGETLSPGQGLAVFVIVGGVYLSQTAYQQG